MRSCKIHDRQLNTRCGQLTHIAQQYDIPIANWLDLSTGIAPTSYPVPQIPEATWRRLPEKSNALIRAAQQYYQGQNLMPISGSQSMIQLLPELMTSQNKTVNRAFIPAIGYQEHKKAWANSCAKVCLYQDIAQLNALTAQDLVVVINPNNPTGTRYTTTQIGHLFEKIKKVGAMLVIDEAFMDGSPEHSFIQHSGDPQLMILRSMGKFFGLAGLRLGFLAAAPLG
ncbi:aminotransferase class I/II-fold pyridoxal phosphate-dependent enzyme [Paraglaciecola aquimarina]|uniref:Aminotransferase n=1 Tax=Paraglaciecola aquimarina TaxID=1235557 RepID=A0ABU3T127_9ALTE|nr:aminotransferase class I/II-fold pyridoxal phosphate-dependent enzyme [Paraglaciecola aquimarina]MDU0355972.1 aminotransferase class I/II-fold pyridoxal phosphate-dependent enzyme [Paraglaciecola aquimarina]